MDIQTINKLAKAHATLISEYTGLTKVEALQLASIVLSILATGGSVEITSTGSGLAETRPQQTSDTPNPARDNAGEGAVLAPAGYSCTCRACGKIVYRLNAPIMARNMGVNALLRAFDPVDHDIPMLRDMLDVLKDADGNTWMDCPLCNQEKTLRIIGSGELPVKDTPTIDSIQGAKGIDPRVLGI